MCGIYDGVAIIHTMGHCFFTHMAVFFMGRKYLAIVSFVCFGSNPCHHPRFRFISIVVCKFDTFLFMLDVVLPGRITRMNAIVNMELLALKQVFVRYISHEIR